MLNSKTLDDLAARIGKAFEGSPAKDIEKNIKAMLQSGLCAARSRDTAGVRHPGRSAAQDARQGRATRGASRGARGEGAATATDGLTRPASGVPGAGRADRSVSRQ